MIDNAEERLQTLCRQAIEEKDLEKVLEIVYQIDQLLESREAKRRRGPSPKA